MEAKRGGIHGGKTFKVYKGNAAVKSRALAHVLEDGEFLGWVVVNVSMLFFSSILFHYIEDVRVLGHTFFSLSGQQFLMLGSSHNMYARKI